MKITALAGGVGGAKLVKGLSSILSHEQLTVIVNTADDFSYHGLYVSPDIDTVLYNLAGVNQPGQGWGRDQDTFHFLDELAKLGEETWFSVGDRDLATHVLRTNQLTQQISLTEITEYLCKARDVKVSILPMTDQPVRTIVNTVEYGEIPFQEYFVKHRFQPRISSIRFDGIEKATLSQDAITAILQSDLIVICPSNPYVSIAPILAVDGVKEHLQYKKVIAVSPFIGGRAVKGPAAKMFSEMGLPTSAMSIARYYGDIIHGLVIDKQDSDERTEIERCGIILLVTDTLMTTNEQKTRLAQEVIDFGKEVLQANKL